MARIPSAQPHGSSGRTSRMNAELSEALRSTSAPELQAWASGIPKTFANVSGRRVQNIGRLGAAVGTRISEEIRGLYGAFNDNRVMTHIHQRGSAASEAAHSKYGEARAAIQTIASVSRDDSGERIQRVAAMVFGFVLGSGGIDGDGGVPDLDLLAGIGAHRSVLTHSIIAGIFMETLLYSVVTLTKTVYPNLPEQHDPLWDDLVAGSERVLSSLSQGMSAGIAYHLGVDATIDGAGTYKDLPFSAPQEAHQGILAGNAAVEATHAATASELRQQQPPSNPSTQWFSSFREASDVAKSNPGMRVVPCPEGGFWVLNRRASSQDRNTGRRTTNRRTTRT